MIPLRRHREPRSFHEEVRIPGLRAIAEMVGMPPLCPRTGGTAFAQRYFPPANGSPPVPITDPADLPSKEFPPYWTKARPHLELVYHRICAYSCFAIHPVTGAATVDHMVPKSVAWHEVYEWRNYRLACSRLNARKNDVQEVLDPWEIQPGWFVLELVGFQVLPGPSVTDPGLKARIQDTIIRLGLNDFCRDRADLAELYWDRQISFYILYRDNPFVATELARQHRLRPGAP